MDWIQILFVVGGLVAYWLNQRAKEKAGEDADYDGDGIPERRAPQRELVPASRDGIDPEQAERVRRIQEEIRRKIAERRGDTSVPPPMERKRVVVEEREPVLRELVAAPSPARVPDAFAHDDSAALQRQQKLAEQLERLEAQRRETRRLAATTFSTQRQVAAAAQVPHAHERAPSLTVDLRNARSLRRAMVLREILDAPVALR